MEPIIAAPLHRHQPALSNIGLHTILLSTRSRSALRSYSPSSFVHFDRSSASPPAEEGRSSNCEYV